MMEPKSKVLIFANTFWYLYKFRSNLMKRLKDDGYEPVACGPIGDSYLKEIEFRSIAYQLDRYSTNPLSELRTLYEIYRIIKREKPSCILTYTPKLNLYATLAARIRKIPYIANISGVGNSFAGSKIRFYIVSIAYRMGLRNAAHVFFQNSQDMTYFEARHLVHGSYSRIYGSGVELERFKSRIVAGNNGRRVFLFAARLIKQKGILEFIEAAQALHEKGQKADFICCGAFEENSIRIAVECAAKNEVIQYLGLVDDMIPVIESADCIVLPTYYNEGVPRILIEAISMGRVVITTSLSGCKDVVVHGENGYLLPNSKARHLIDAMNGFCKLQDCQIATMGQKSRALAEERFSEEVIVNEYMKILKMQNVDNLAAEEG